MTCLMGDLELVCTAALKPTLGPSMPLVCNAPGFSSPGLSRRWHIGEWVAAARNAVQYEGVE
jgi:hypothetical protein